MLMNVFKFHSLNENNYFYIEKGERKREYVGSLNTIIVSDFQKHEGLKETSWERQIPGCQFLVSFPVKHNEAWGVRSPGFRGHSLGTPT